MRGGEEEEMKIFRRTLHLQRSSENVIQTAFTIIGEEEAENGGGAAEVSFKNRHSPRTPPQSGQTHTSHPINTTNTNTTGTTAREWTFNPFLPRTDSPRKYSLAEISEPLYRTPSLHSLHSLPVTPSARLPPPQANTSTSAATAAVAERREVRRGGEVGEREGDIETETTDVHLALAPSYQNTRFEAKNAYTIVPVDQNYDLSSSVPEPHYSERIDCTKLGYVY